MFPPDCESSWVSQIPWCLHFRHKRVALFSRMLVLKSFSSLSERRKMSDDHWTSLAGTAVSRWSQGGLILHVDWVSVMGRAWIEGPEKPNSNPRTAMKLWFSQVTWASHLISVGIHSSLVQWGRWIRSFYNSFWLWNLIAQAEGSWSLVRSSSRVCDPECDHPPFQSFSQTPSVRKILSPCPYWICPFMACTLCLSSLF